jgi:hypothetical protein
MDKVLQGFLKEKLIKSQIKEAMNDYCNSALIDKIKEIFLNNLNYSELINLKLNIFLPDMSANFYFKDNKVQAYCSPLSITLYSKYNTIFFNKKNKEKILSNIENLLKVKDLLQEDIWSFAKLKDSFLLINVAGPNSINIPQGIRENIKKNTVIIQELKHVWDATKF